MSYGLSQGGINVLGGIDINSECEATYTANIKDAIYVCKDVFELREEDLDTYFAIEKNDDNMVFVGCSPCQYWSIIQTDKTKSARSKNLLQEFERFVSYYRPGYVLVENVPGILRKSEESGFDAFVDHLEKMDYAVHFEVVNMNEYGVPQARRPAIILSRTFFRAARSAMTPTVAVARPGRPLPSGDGPMHRTR